ncbi:MAG: iron-sulfur cluster repair di-iron protein [Phycisphaerales bacterium]|nr:iron-sulfur cluster repair di-iron protein [Phycisphaerales bacterium]
MPSQPRLDRTIGQLVVERPARARVFERYGLDYCCGGKAPLTEACRKQGLSFDAICRELATIDDGAEPLQTDWSTVTMAELADHIVDAHHIHLRRELPRLDALLEKVTRVHGDNHPELRQCREVFLSLAAELNTHMLKEEQVLFPMIRQLETGQSSPVIGCGSIDNPIRVMEHEHDDTGRALARLRTLTNGYVPPADACNTYRVMLDSLSELERDLHTHIHKENNILFPRAIAVAQSCAS